MTAVTPKPYERLLRLLEDLPPERLDLLERFARFLREESRRDRAVEGIQGKPVSLLYPTVALPASSLDAWVDLLPAGYEGDALADTEALYDEV